MSTETFTVRNNLSTMGTKRMVLFDNNKSPKMSERTYFRVAGIGSENIYAEYAAGVKYEVFDMREIKLKLI